MVYRIYDRSKEAGIVKQKFTLYVLNKNYCTINIMALSTEIKNSVISIEFLSIREFGGLS